MNQQPQGLPSPVVHLQTLGACWIMKDDMAMSCHVNAETMLFWAKLSDLTAHIYFRLFVV